MIIIDGTQSSLRRGRETNAGLLYKLLCEMAPQAELDVHYEAGIQWEGWLSTPDVLVGRGVNRQIRRVYGHLASRHRPGDRIFLFGYSRGAYAVRSLAGVIDRVGLLQADAATERNVRQAYRLYQHGGSAETEAAFRRLMCHPETEIEMVGVWDTVKALGLRLPILWRWTQRPHLFHNHQLGAHIRHGFHALARDETRLAYAPIMWESWPGYPGRVEQVWFRGSHGDIGGHLSGYLAARPLANIPLVWMLKKASDCGLPLPQGWAQRFVRDVTAPSVGTFRGAGGLLLSRRRRVMLQDPSEALHRSIADR